VCRHGSFSALDVVRHQGVMQTSRRDATGLELLEEGRMALLVAQNLTESALL